MEFLNPATRVDAERRGLWLGFIGVAMFSLTLPATRIAVRHLDPIFVGLGRSLLAAALAAIFLLAWRERRPTIGQFKQLAVVAAGVIFGFPALTSWAMRHVPSAHGAIVVGLMPLATAIIGAWINHERPSRGFWMAAWVGSALVVAFAVFHGGGALQLADLALFVAVLLGALGYALGARVTRELGGPRTICWALVISVPFLVLPVTWGAARSDFAAASAVEWAGFLYVAVFSQLIGFFAWYRGLDIGGIARVSQVQLTQVFLTMLFSGLLLGEAITPLMLVFAVAVVATVAIGRRMPVARA